MYQKLDNYVLNYLYKFGTMLVEGDKMYRIAVCDNEEHIVNEISEILYQAAPKYDADIHVFTYTNGKAVLDSGIRFNLIFMDIKLSEINGINLARRIRKRDSKVQIVYVTKYLNFLREAYRVHAFDYIQKPFKPEVIDRVFEDYLRFTSFVNKDVLKVKEINGRDLLLATDEILYISCGSKKREVIIITQNRDFICRGVISEIFSELNNFDFFMPHRSHIINLSQVKSYIKNEKIFMINEDEIPLSKGRSNEFERVYSRKIDQL